MVERLNEHDNNVHVYIEDRERDECCTNKSTRLDILFRRITNYCEVQTEANHRVEMMLSSPTNCMHQV